MFYVTVRSIRQVHKYPIDEMWGGSFESWEFSGVEEGKCRSLYEGKKRNRADEEIMMRSSARFC